MTAVSVGAAMIAGLTHCPPAYAAEGGQSPYLKGYRDILTGLVPPEPGTYLRKDVASYTGEVDRTVLNGLIRGNLEADAVADLVALTYVTPHKLFGGTFAFGFAPTLLYANVDIGLSVGSLSRSASDSEFNIGDAVITPAMLGWQHGNWHWNAAVAVLLPIGKYDIDDLANTSKNYWSVMPQVGLSYFDPKTGWDFSGAVIYVVNWENPDTNYETGDILHVEGAISKSFGAWRLGVVGYAMKQLTGDSGEGAVLGDHKSEVYGVGPLVGYTFTVGQTPVTVLGKWYHEFGAKDTQEGDSVTAAVSFKF